MSVWSPRPAANPVSGGASRNQGDVIENEGRICARVLHVVRRPMITICHPVDDLELVFLRAALEAADVPYFVVGQHFGSLYPGMQIPSYNERSVRVPPGYAEKALKVIEQVRSSYSPTFERLTTKSKLRILIEGLLLGWVIPAGTKKPSNISSNPDGRPPAN